ncbi:hypothetical protein [Coxiella endosymbiont of Ornithodoros amblus]|uniref:hypothetical protein n=1 Tax=Coxiella endosymbiont of Ornithodoros amblus TaxID=1656166 RepID=UPI00244E08B3|nr:hypothetical protein [Coxiella endosymbiont of Ornithodoros amblus]
MDARYFEHSPVGHFPLDQQKLMIDLFLLKKAEGEAKFLRKDGLALDRMVSYFSKFKSMKFNQIIL